MYEYLDGRLTSRHPARVVVDVHGVGYDVAVPVGADFASRAGGVGGDQRVRVWTHLVVREDAHTLYGFPDPGMRGVFRLLLLVRGVGPGLAIAILSSLPGDDLLRAVAAGDVAALTSIRGVGKKTAEQILLDLRDKAPATLGAGGETVVPAAPPRSQAIADAVQALTSIGYTDKQAQKSVERASQRVDPEDLELLVRTALQE